MWQLTFAANTVVAAAYLTIAYLVVRGLQRSGQLGLGNALGTATAGIFFTCAVGHGIHAEHLLTDPASRVMADWHLGVWDTITAAVAVTYLSLRKSYAQLLQRPSMFEDVAQVQADELVRTAFEESPIGMGVLGLDGRVLRANGMLAATLRGGMEELQGRSGAELVAEDDRPVVERALDGLASGRSDRWSGELVMLRVDGTTVPALVSAAVVRDDGGAPIHLVCHVEDLSHRRAAEAARLAAEQRFAAAFEHAPIGEALLGLRGEEAGRVLRVNPALTELLGLPVPGLEGGSLAQHLDAEDVPVWLDVLDRLRSGAVRAQQEVRLRAPDGHATWVLVSAAPLPSSDGLARHAVVHVLDMTERKRFEQQLRQLADHDALTGLYNRRRFDAELERTLALARRYGGRGALVLLDIDGFKFVNDTQGHSAGDELVVRIGTILAAQLRTTDVLGRVGGDEFCVLLPEVDEAEAVLVAEKILHAIRRQATVERPGRLPRITASAGIATYGNRPGSITAEDLTATADMAMYDAKDRGRDRVAVYAEGDQPRTRLTDRAEWTSRLEAAVADDRFRLVAQPIVGITANGVPRAELLLRYLGDDGRLVAPGVFLYLAERSDLICQIDRWVLSEAVRHLGDVHERGRDLALAVNLSARTLVDPDLPVYLEGLLASRRIPAGRLVIEVTETAAIVNIDRARRFADDLHRLGCRLALDDFGSGFASFYYLKHLAFDYVKIDGEFIKHLPENRTDRLVVEAVVGIARGLGTRTVAEFVGSPEVVQVLEELGVDYGQGYHLGMPAPVEELLEDVVRAPRFAPGAAGLPVAPPQAVGPDDG